MPVAHITIARLISRAALAALTTMSLAGCDKPPAVDSPLAGLPSNERLKEPGTASTPAMEGGGAMPGLRNGQPLPEEPASHRGEREPRR